MDEQGWVPTDDELAVIDRVTADFMAFVEARVTIAAAISGNFDEDMERARLRENLPPAELPKAGARDA